VDLLELYSVISIVAFFADFLLLSYMLLNARKTKTHKHFLIIISLVTVWQLLDFMTKVTTDMPVVINESRVIFAFISYLPVYILLFSFDLTNKEIKEGTKILIFSIASFLASMSLFTPLILKSGQVKPWGNWMVTGDAFWIFTIFFTICSFVGLYYVIQMYRRATNPSTIKALRHIVIGMALPIVFGITTNIILPTLDISFPPVASLATTVMVVLFVYSIMRYDL
jgi:hypothetical protein